MLFPMLCAKLFEYSTYPSTWSRYLGNGIRVTVHGTFLSISIYSSAGNRFLVARYSSTDIRVLTEYSPLQGSRVPVPDSRCKVTDYRYPTTKTWYLMYHAKYSSRPLSYWYTESLIFHHDDQSSGHQRLTFTNVKWLRQSANDGALSVQSITQRGGQKKMKRTT